MIELIAQDNYVYTNGIKFGKIIAIPNEDLNKWTLILKTEIPELEFSKKEDNLELNNNIFD